MLKQAVYLLLILPDFSSLGTQPYCNKWEPTTTPHTKMAHITVNPYLDRLSVNSYWDVDIASVVETSIKLWLSHCYRTVQVLIHVLLIRYVVLQNIHLIWCVSSRLCIGIYSHWLSLLASEFRTQESGRVYSMRNYTWKYNIRITLQNNTSILNKYRPDAIKTHKYILGDLYWGHN